MKPYLCFALKDPSGIFNILLSSSVSHYSCANKGRCWGRLFLYLNKQNNFLSICTTGTYLFDNSFSGNLVWSSGSHCLTQQVQSHLGISSSMATQTETSPFFFNLKVQLWIWVLFVVYMPDPFRYLLFSMSSWQSSTKWVLFLPIVCA